MTDDTKANDAMQEVASRLKLSAAEVDEMVKLGISAETLTTIGAKLAPLHAQLDASARGSKEEDEAAWAVVRIVLGGG